MFKEWFKIRDEKRVHLYGEENGTIDGLIRAINVFDYRHQQKLRLVVYGGITSIVTKTLFAPIERLKIELQICRHLKASVAARMNSSEIVPYALIGASTSEMDVATLYHKKGLSGYIKTVTSTEGFTALFRGNGLNVIRVVPTRQLSCMLFRRVDWLSQMPGKEIFIVLSSAMMSGFNLTVFAYPLDLIRTRLTVIPYYSKYQFRASIFPYGGSAYRCVREMLKHEGIFSLWKGMGTSLVGVVPYITCTFATYEFLKLTVHKKMQELYGKAIESGSMVDLSLKLSYGTISSFLGKTISYPFDTVRRRRQLMGCMPNMLNSFVMPHASSEVKAHPSLIKLEADEYTSGVHRYGNNCVKVSQISNSTLEPLFTQNGKPMYKTTYHALMAIFKEEGIRALFRGWKLNVIKCVPGHALHFVLYEQCKNILGYDRSVLTEDEELEDDDDDL